MSTRHPASTSRLRRFVEWAFRNRRTGRITVAQVPNLPLSIFLATVVIRWFTPAGSDAGTYLAWIGCAGLSWWAVDEVCRGVNPWRRTLGIAGCAVAVVEVVSLVTR